MSDLSYDDAKKKVFLGFWVLLGVTLVEVGVSLFGKGHLIEGVENLSWLVAIAALLIIVLSIYKAKYIIYEFMHMGYEVQGLRVSVLLPTALLIWAIVAFFQEGNAWKNRREQIKEKNEVKMESDASKLELQGYILEDDTYDLRG
ncbi:MAG: cytochrome C oxidase subunit IV family protein [Bacteroidota bacterium]